MVKNMMDAEDSKLVTVSFADHSKYVAMALRNLFDSKRGTDFDFRLDGKSVRAHRLIIDLFLEPELTGTIQNEMRVPPTVKQEVPDDDYGSGNDILNSLMEFLYKGEVIVHEQQLEHLLRVAKELDFQMLVDAVHVCRPVDIMADNELNVGMGTDGYCSESVIKVERLPGHRNEDAKITHETFGNTDSLPHDVKGEITFRTCSRFISETRVGEGLDKNSGEHLLHDTRPRDCCKVSNSKSYNVQTKDMIADSVDLHYRLEEGATESLDLALPHSGSDEDDGVITNDNTLCSSSDPDIKKTGKCMATKIVRGEPIPKHKCPHCKFETSFRGSLQKHCLSLHRLTVRGDPAPIYKCPECNFSSVYPSLLKVHQDTKHTQEGKHACPHCTYVGKVKFSLKRHMNVVHGVGVSRFNCEVCGRRCVSRTHLARHIRGHNNQQISAQNK